MATLLPEEESLAERVRCKELCIGIVTISDRCNSGCAEDKSAPALQDAILKGDQICGKIVRRTIVPDEEVEIKKVLVDWCSSEQMDIIFTIGGTGISPRDVTPEAVKEVLHKELPGMAIRMITESLQVTPLAMLSRPICGIRNKTIIITFPGSQRGCVQCFSYIAPSLNHAVDLVRDYKVKVEKTHADLRGTTECDKPSTVQPTKVSSRNRESPYPMISVEEAHNIILSEVEFASSIKKLPMECVDHVIAHEVCATENVPMFNASRMDGYAVRSVDGPGHKQVICGHVAGEKVILDKSLDIQTCVRVSTGAAIPEGADAVVPVEETQLISESNDKGEENIINTNFKPKAFQHIRKIGSDMKKGELILAPGTLVSPSDVGVLVSSGNYAVFVHPKPVIAVLSTGTELQDLKDRPLKHGYTYDCNRPTLISLLKRYASRIYDAGIAPDNPTELRTSLYLALSNADVIITSGGVSMGEKDMLKAVLECDFGAKIQFGRVCMKPGKPTTFATCKFKNVKKYIFGLPGNPVSAVVAATVFVLPLCRKFSGSRKYFGTKIKAKLVRKTRLDDVRWEYIRVTLEWKSSIPEATDTGSQESSRIMSLSDASGLAFLPPSTTDRKFIESGEEVDVLLLDL